MSQVHETSDEAVLDHLRRTGSASVSVLMSEMGVTATAVRQRLNRLIAEGLVEKQLSQRDSEPSGRGRPSHQYTLTAQGHRESGTNYADLAMVLWEEVRSVRDPEVRRGLLKRIVERLAAHYKKSVEGDTIKARLASLAELLGQRKVPFEVDESGDLPVLTALACPYPDLAEQDRSICAMEKMLFSEVVGEGVQLTSCRLDGATCCTFEPSNS